MIPEREREREYGNGASATATSVLLLPMREEGVGEGGVGPHLKRWWWRGVSLYYYSVRKESLGKLKGKLFKTKEKIKFKQTPEIRIHKSKNFPLFICLFLPQNPKNPNQMVPHEWLSSATLSLS